LSFGGVNFGVTRKSFDVFINALFLASRQTFITCYNKASASIISTVKWAFDDKSIS
jgi:hypothetical protein